MKEIGKTLLVMIAAAILAVGCGHHHSEEGYYEEEYVCCPEPEPVIEVWEQCSLDWNTLYVGEECACGACDLGPSCFNPFDCCLWADQDYSWDTIGLSSWDENLLDLQFNFTLTNWGNQTTRAWVMLCDNLGCEDLIEIDLFPGEVYWDRLPSPVLDTLLEEFDDCLWWWGDACWMDYDVDVYLGEECVCSPVTLDYYYDGLYVY